MPKTTLRAAAAALAVMTLTAVTVVGVATAQSAAPTGSPVSTCNNPVLNSDLTGWGPIRGSVPIRQALSTTDHTVARWAYQQSGNSVRDASFFLPQQKDVTPVEQWTFATDLRAAGGGSVRARVEVDFYNSSGGFLGHQDGAWTPIVTAATPAPWTRVSHTTTIPPGVTRVNVLSDVEAVSAPFSFAATACEYRKGVATAPTTTPAPTTTVAPTTVQPTTVLPSPPTSQPPRTTEVELPSSAPPPPPQAGGTAAALLGWGSPLPASDEFNYTGAPDPTKWNQAGECWPANSTVKAGRCASRSTVNGTALIQDGRVDGKSPWLESKFGQKYGRWEVRAKSVATGPNNGRQFHPLLLLWPDSNQHPQGAEYDFLENGAPGAPCAEAFLHYPNHQPKVQEFSQKCGVDLTQWHNFALDWSPAGLKGYVDGVKWFDYSSNGIQNAPGPMHQTIQLDNFSGTGMQPATYSIDWARVYAP